MDDSIRLGRIAGLQVGINWSLLIVFWLIVWSLAGGLLQSVSPGLPPGAYWVAGTVAAVAFYGSLLTHELAHALVARRLGVEVDGITLWLFGGVARLRQDPPTPGGEARIAVVGPLASLALALGFAGLAALLGGRVGLELASATAGWLGVTNLLLAVFNMVPAFPLDGGRVLRAALWRRTGDRDRATRWAARAGRGFAYVLIGTSLVGFVLGLPLGSLWTVFLGWFLLAATRSEEARAQFRSALAGMRVAEVMSRDLLIAPSYITVEEFVRSYVFLHRYAAYPLKSFDGHLDGLMAASSVSSLPRERWRATRVIDLACPLRDVPTTHPEELLTDVLPRLGQSTEGRALVLQDGEVVGMLGPADITRALQLASPGPLDAE